MKSLSYSLLLLALFLQNGVAAEAHKPKPAADASQFKPKKNSKQEAVRVRFVPGGGPMKGSSDYKGASCTTLTQGPDPKALWLQAHAGVGDKFPVQDDGGVQLFEVLLQKGDDDHVVLEIQSKEGRKEVNLGRDKKRSVSVGGVQYDLAYPSVSVAASPGEKPTTNKAMLMITRQLEEKK